MVIDQVLPDGHGVAPPAKRFDDQLTVGFAGARSRRSIGALPGHGGGGTRARTGRGCHRRVSGHLRRNGRFCRTSGRAATAPHRQASRLQVAAGGFAPEPPVASSIRRSDQPRRPSARTSCRFSTVKTLLMPGRNVPFPTGVNVSGRYPKWPVFVDEGSAGARDTPGSSGSPAGSVSPSVPATGPPSPPPTTPPGRGSPRRCRRSGSPHHRRGARPPSIGSCACRLAHSAPGPLATGHPTTLPPYQPSCLVVRHVIIFGYGHGLQRAIIDESQHRTPERLIMAQH